MESGKKILTAMIVASIAMVGMIQLATPTSADEPKKGDILLMHHPTWGWWSMGFFRHCALCTYWESHENNEFIHTSEYVEYTTESDLIDTGWLNLTYVRVVDDYGHDLSPSEINAAINHAGKQEGEPYVSGSPWYVLWRFRHKFDDHGDWYCSELMWAAYHKPLGIDIDSGDCPWSICGFGVSPDEIWYDDNTEYVTGSGME